MVDAMTNNFKVQTRLNVMYGFRDRFMGLSNKLNKIAANFDVVSPDHDSSVVKDLYDALGYRTTQWHETLDTVKKMVDKFRDYK